QSRFRWREHHVGMDGAGQRPGDGGFEPVGTGARLPAKPAMAALGAVLGDGRTLGRGTGSPQGQGAARSDGPLAVRRRYIEPPGDYLSTYMAQLTSQGSAVYPAKIAALRAQYGLDQPFLIQYATWLGGLLHGDLGYSFEYDLPVAQMVGDRLLLTMILSLATI